ncbi:hypothetical protein C1Y40_03370 [Mycobacterium talmoniae]|uniref:Uncharacterized protein n=1 Tax=Mycobacterium talmoniae TaxID=1858794 RepID=A0A2S8BIF3_9MYCO|nr:hypothetical protein C1Y40_03370 [Mycobacterium talmoniae]
MFRFAAQRWIASPDSAWLSKIGPELAMMSSISVMLVLKSPTIAWVESTNRCSDGPNPPTAWAVSSSSPPILSAGSAANPRLAVSKAGPIGDGTVLRGRPSANFWGMVCPGRKCCGGLPLDTRSRYCSPTADTECTFADASIGILYLLAMLIVARAPASVGSTLVTLPMVVPRYVTLEVAYSPPDEGRSAVSVYWPIPTSEGIRR